MARYPDLKANIHSAMERVGIGAEEIAAALRIKPSTYYYRMQRAEERLSVNDLRVIARKTDTTAAWLISGTPAKR